MIFCVVAFLAVLLSHKIYIKQQTTPMVKNRLLLLVFIC